MLQCVAVDESVASPFDRQLCVGVCWGVLECVGILQCFAVCRSE